MKNGYKMALVVGIVGFCFICYRLLNTDVFPRAWMCFSVCGIIGSVISFLFVLVTQYYTDYNFAPVQKIVKGSHTGHATNIIAGLSVGLESTGFPVLIISAGVLLAFHIGKYTGITNIYG